MAKAVGFGIGVGMCAGRNAGLRARRRRVSRRCAERVGAGLGFRRLIQPHHPAFEAGPGRRVAIEHRGIGLRDPNDEEQTRPAFIDRLTLTLQIAHAT